MAISVGSLPSMDENALMTMFAPEMPEMASTPAQAVQGCWTCKRRKIGCDRSLPGCNNCKRTGRQCLGYGKRLVWPDQPDRRRQVQKVDNASHAPMAPTRGSKPYLGYMLNTMHEDLAAPQKTLSMRQLVVKAGLLARPTSLFPYPAMEEGEKHLMTYYEQRLSRMISTIDTRNGFRFELLPKALSPLFFASDALRNAILAVSAYHRSGAEAALKYKANAVRHLSRSLSTCEASSGIQVASTQLATTMMLCVYSVFDESEGNWSSHLQGAQSILHQFTPICGDGEFLYTWFLYHHVLGAFSRPQQNTLDDSAPFDIMRNRGFDKTFIIGSLGCSLEVLEVIHRTNILRDDMLRGRAVTAESRSDLESQLLELKQKIEFTQDFDGSDAEVCLYPERSRILSTAEFYRMAALLYLRRVFAVPGDTKATILYVQRAFQILDSLEECTSPWPLFILACEAETDNQRIGILQALDQMDTRRAVGNVFVLRAITEMFWKQKDLEEDACRRRQMKWWNVTTLDAAGPWFI